MQGLRFITYTSYILLYIIHIFIESQLILYTVGWIGMLAVIISFCGANRTYQILSVVFFTVSLFLFFFYDLSLSEVPVYFTPMALLLSLLYMIPLINHFMIVGRFERSLYRLLQANTTDLAQFYRRTSLTHYILGLFIFLSAIPIVYRFVQQRLTGFADQVLHRFATQSMLRSFASVNVWSPIEVYIALVLGITSVSYLHILPWLLAFSGFMLFLDWLLAIKYKHYSFENNTVTAAFTKKEARKLLTMVGFLILFIGTAAGVHLLFGLDFFEAIIVIIAPYTLIWALAIKRQKIFLRYNVLTWPGQIKTMQNFMLLFLSLGLFNEVVERTGIFNQLRTPLSFIGETPFFLFFVLQFSALALACLGVHPLVTISMQGLFVEPFLQDINPMSIAIVMITSTLANDAAGTFNVPITMMTQYMKRNPYQLTWWNLPFALIFGGTGVVLAFLLL
ncbi:hypothetical protein D7Z54_31500 [Salibacterium salarium]|uniref:Citrate transporter-like domain-containing protein n=1 Tax=Salibacterium salarium TaxID=284579 RepID=A0A3R9QMW1_9BACI|nr:hypothetical protein [Salibacterium salarium]RSL29390.1 hypothetical protein D7Z54_31500 [Salibacterium salarium]